MILQTPDGLFLSSNYCIITILEMTLNANLFPVMIMKKYLNKQYSRDGLASWTITKWTQMDKVDTDELSQAECLGVYC